MSKSAQSRKPNTLFWHPLEPSVQDTSYTVEMENAFLQKQIIRNNIRNTVKQLKFIEQKYAADSITNLIINYLNLHTNYQNIACYWPTKYEINTVSLIKFLLDNNKSCYLPVINNKNSTLNFIKYDNNTQLIKNKFEISEPKLLHILKYVFFKVCSSHRLSVRAPQSCRSLVTSGYLNLLPGI